jgi:hypothetical protein
MKISLAVLALLSTARAVNVNTVAGEKALTEATRYVGSDGNPIILAQSSGHLRLGLTKIKKFGSPQPIDNAELMLNSCDPQAVAEQANTNGIDDVTHCPINKDGKPVQAHIIQNNLEDNAYVSEMYVGNPPQLVKALFDTGSTNTWVLNS